MDHRYNQSTTSVPVSSLVSSTQPQRDSSADTLFPQASSAHQDAGSSSSLRSSSRGGDFTSPSSVNLRHHDEKPAETNSNSATLNARIQLIDEFFIKNGAHRPPHPCAYCKRLRLQCLILRTTAANPNPIESCSSCVALYRDCSLAERSKREAQTYETPLPVIGHLHGVAEEEMNVDLEAADANIDITIDANANVNIDKHHPMFPMDDSHERHQHGQHQGGLEATMGSGYGSLSSGQPPPTLCRRNSSDSVKRIRVLRNWFAGHWEHPYPNEQEKAALVDQSGLTKTQVVNWFANARRRQRAMAQSHLDAGNKLFAHGSPMPEFSMAGLSPIERWRSSPQSDEHISAGDLEDTMDTSGMYSGDRVPIAVSDRSNTSDGVHSPGSGDSSFYHHHAPQEDWPLTTPPALPMYPAGDGGPQNHGQLRIPMPMQRDDRIFQCTFCHQSFKKKYDWVRHERSIHLPGLDTWICAMPLAETQSSVVWRLGKDHPECLFCGEPSPTAEHIQSHEFKACAERPLSERTFTRKDHLWQHLHKFHQCRKWEGWRPNLQLLQRSRDEVESECGFCKFRMTSWSERADHLGKHFRNGAVLADWVGGPRIKDVKYEGLLCWD